MKSSVCLHCRSELEKPQPFQQTYDITPCMPSNVLKHKTLACKPYVLSVCRPAYMCHSLCLSVRLSITPPIRYPPIRYPASLASQGQGQKLPHARSLSLSLCLSLSLSLPVCLSVRMYVCSFICLHIEHTCTCPYIGKHRHDGGLIIRLFGGGICDI